MTERLKKYIEFVDSSIPGRLTRRWSIINKRTHQLCGTIKWSGAWRKYIFETANEGDFYDWDFMREVGNFCEQETLKHLGKI